MNIAILGANRGIGLALVEQYLQENHRVWAICRNTSDAIENLYCDELTVITKVDFQKEPSVESLLQLLPRNLDVIIYNAGILHTDTLENFQPTDIQEQIQVNAITPLCTIRTLLPIIPQGSKIAIITSSMGSMKENSGGGYYGYRMSKAAVNMAGVNLSIDLRPKNISVFLLHPGYVQTDMTGGKGFITPTQSAEGLYARLQELTFSQTGSFWHVDGRKVEW